MSSASVGRAANYIGALEGPVAGLSVFPVARKLLL